MKSETTDFLGLIKGPRQYRIPPFQRAYSWEKEDRDTLWLDILNQYARLIAVWSDPERETRLANMPGHYLGTVVLAGPSALGVPKSDVIDGQQRMTTLLLLLCALRDVRVRNEIKSNADDSQERAKQIRKRFVRRYLLNEDEVGPDELRLVPLKADRKAFKAIVNHDGIGSLTPENVGLSEQDSQRVLQAYKFFLTELRRKDIDVTRSPQLARFAGMFPLDLDVLEEAITRRLTLITIETANVDDVNSIFESLNATGRPLTQLDLLRNYIFMTLKGRAEAVLEEYWSTVEQHLHRPQEVELLVWADIVSRGTSVLQKRTYRTVQSELREAGGSPAAAEAYLKRLAGFAPAFATILHPSRESDPNVRRALDHIARAGGSTATPLVLWILRQRLEGQIETQGVVNALSLVESLLVRRMVAGSATNLLGSVFAQVLARLHADDSELPVGERLRKAMTANSKDWPGDEMVLAGVRNVDFYHSQKSMQRMFILSSIDHYLAPDTVLNYGETDDSIEHIMPQSYQPAWRSDLAEAGEDYEALKDAWLHTLPNLTVVTPMENNVLGAQRFAQKASHYGDSQYALTRSLASDYVALTGGNVVWGKAAFEARAQRLAEVICARWERPSSPADDEPITIDEFDIDPGEEVASEVYIEEAELLAVPVGDEAVSPFDSQRTGAPERSGNV